MRCRGRVHGDRAARAGDRRRHGIRGRDGTRSGRDERRAVRECMDAVVAANERVVRWHHHADTRVGGGELHRARVTGCRVVERIPSGDSEAERYSGRRGCRTGDREVTRR